MVDVTRLRIIAVALTGLALSGCVAAVPVQPTFAVIPGQGKTEANLRADDAACRIAAAVPVSERQYYGCMASHGEAVIQQQSQSYAAVPYVVPAYAAYPGYGYPYGYGYGYPYYGGYYGPFVGFGVGFGFGHYGRFGGYGGGFHGGYRH